MKEIKQLNSYLLEVKERTDKMNLTYRPLFFRLNIPDDAEALNQLKESDLIDSVNDDIILQIRELIKIRNPSIQLTEDDYDARIKAHISDIELSEYGLWVYYPWKKAIVHCLDEQEYIEVRTNRNKNKITVEEQNILSKKTIAVIGLSVGNSIAVTLAMERTCGCIKLADFDTIELSNLNRIRTGLTSLSIQKVIVAAREIAEIDPFIQIEIFNEGISKANIDQFLKKETEKIDLLVEVCDSLSVKLESRFYARKAGIPVVMDTSDRGMIDVERFDLEPERTIFHDKVDEELLDFNNLIIDHSNRMNLLKSIVDYDSLSDRMKESMAEIGITINTWPQLASSVTLGGGATADISRKILLNQHVNSGRYYVDIDSIFST